LYKKTFSFHRWVKLYLLTFFA